MALNGMLDPEHAKEFAHEWISAWNARALEAALAHFAEDAVFTSPLAATVVPSSGGMIQGRDALREYWRAGLARHPDLRFEHLGTYLGVDTVVINYKDQAGGIVTEILRFSGSLIVEGHSTRLVEAAH